jgi:hypothetical protein
MSKPGLPHSVRYADDEFEMRCLSCGYYWPLTLEFWYPTRSLARCTACDRAHSSTVKEAKKKADRERTARWRADPLNHERHLEACKRWYWANHEQILASKRAHRKKAA